MDEDGGRLRKKMRLFMYVSDGMKKVYIIKSSVNKLTEWNKVNIYIHDSNVVP